VFSRCEHPFGFVSRCALAVVNADGTGLRTILGGNNVHAKPVVSPNGRTIAFMSDKGGLESAIWVVGIDGSNPRRLTAPRTRAFWPDFTADGSHILYGNNCCLPHSDVFSVPVGGGAATKLTNAPAGEDDTFASASPSGRNIVFNGGNDQGTRLEIRRSDGSLKTVLGGIHDAVASDWGSAPLGPTQGDGSRLPIAAARQVTRHAAARAAAPAVSDASAPTAAATADPARPGRIVYADYFAHEIFSISGAGGHPVQLTHTGGSAFDPGLSADGKHIVFLRIPADGQPRIWIMKADGSNQHQVGTDGPAFAQVQPVFTPDGRIVFSRCNPEVCAIWIMDADGANKRALTPFTQNASNEASDNFAAVSPDGRHVAFERFFDGGFLSRVFVIGIDGRNAHPVTPAWLEAGDPAWSPGGGRIAVTSQGVFPRLGLNIWTVAAGGGDLKRLTTTAYPNNDLQPTYSPDGTRIAFVSDRRYDDFCCQDLFAMRTDGGQQHQLSTGTNVGVNSPSWGLSVGGTNSATATATATSASTSTRELWGRAPRSTYRW
jgi:Tol biopolymer transport system component